MCEKKPSSFESFKLTRERENALRKNGPDILKTLKLTPIFYSILLADYTLTEEMEQEIKAETTLHSQISKLLHLIPKRGNKGFETFLKAMVDTHQESIASLLDSSFASDLISSRDDRSQNNDGAVQVQDAGDSQTQVQSNASLQSVSTEIDGPSVSSNTPPATVNQSAQGAILPTATPAPFHHPPYNMSQPPGMPYNLPYPYQLMQFPQYASHPHPHLQSMLHPQPDPNAYLHQLPQYPYPFFPQNSHTPANFAYPGGMQDGLALRTAQLQLTVTNANRQENGLVQASSESSAEGHSQLLCQPINTESKKIMSNTVPACTSTRNAQDEVEMVVVSSSTTAAEAGIGDTRDEDSTDAVSSMTTHAGARNIDKRDEDRTDTTSSKNVYSTEINEVSKICKFVDESTLRQYLSSLNPHRLEDVKDFIAAVCGKPIMDIKVKKVKTANQAVDLIKTQNCYCIRRQPKAGLVILIAIENFFKKPLRKGTEFDIANIKSLFDQLNFDVNEFKDLSAEEIKNTLRDESQNTDLSKYDVFVLIIMSHGEEGQVFGSEGNKTVSVKEIVDIFDGTNCKNLKGKPKLFFFQACQGNMKSVMQTDGPVEVDSETLVKSVMQTDGSGDTGRPIDDSEQNERFRQWAANFFHNDTYKPTLPKIINSGSYQTDGPEHDKANLFVAYASYKGYLAWRLDELGSFFIRGLIHVFARYSHEKHVGDLFTELNYLLGYLPSKDGNTLIHQTAHFESTLNKSLYLFPGYDGRDFT